MSKMTTKILLWTRRYALSHRHNPLDNLQIQQTLRLVTAHRHQAKERAGRLQSLSPNQARRHNPTLPFSSHPPLQIYGLLLLPLPLLFGPVCDQKLSRRLYTISCQPLLRRIARP